MIEVFKTNVEDRHHAIMLIDQIRNTYIDYNANFDLEDCDKILRVKCASGCVEACLVIDLLKQLGFHAEILEDEKPSVLQFRLFDRNYYSASE